MSIIATPEPKNHNFNKRIFLVRISELYLRTANDVKMHGTYITGYKEIDDDVYNRNVTVYMNIPTMVKHYHNGATISVVNASDLRIMYETIVDHLHKWSGILDRELNVGDAPIDELIQLDAFAEHLFRHTRYEYVNNREIGGVIGAMNRISRKARKPFIKDKVKGFSLDKLPKYKTRKQEFISKGVEIKNDRYK